ncbi:MAG: hypothetical protein ACM34L_16385 [Gemmatimonas sp.]
MYDDLVIAAVFAIAAIMLKTWLTHRERMRELSLTKPTLAPSDERLARLEQAVESIAVEVERIGEGQRFVTKLMNDRAQPALQGVPIPAPPRKVDTPH